MKEGGRMSNERALENAIASVQMEGFPVSAQMKDDCVRLLNGELSVAELVKEILARPVKAEG